MRQTTRSARGFIDILMRRCACCAARYALIQIIHCLIIDMSMTYAQCAMQPLLTRFSAAL